MSLFSSDSSLDTKSLGGNSSTAYSTSPSFVVDDEDSFLGSSKASTKRHRRQGSQALLNLSAGDRKIAGLRRLIYFAILLLGLGIAFLVYFAIDEEEKQAFESHFQEDATQVLQSFTLQIDLVFGALNTFALNIASIAKATNQTWPNVTVPDFGAKAETTRGTSPMGLCRYDINVLSLSHRLFYGQPSSVQRPVSRLVYECSGGGKRPMGSLHS